MTHTFLIYKKIRKQPNSQEQQGVAVVTLKIMAALARIRIFPDDNLHLPNALRIHIKLVLENKLFLRNFIILKKHLPLSPLLNALPRRI